MPAYKNTINLSYANKVSFNENSRNISFGISFIFQKKFFLGKSFLITYFLDSFYLNIIYFPGAKIVFASSTYQTREQNWKKHLIYILLCFLKFISELNFFLYVHPVASFFVFIFIIVCIETMQNLSYFASRGYTLT